MASDDTTMDLMAPVRASTRVSIAWGGREASEDTDTLVLTLDGMSVDLRIMLDSGEIEWASVGAISYGEGHSDATPSLIWTQLLDSRPAPPTPASPGAFEILSTTDVRESGEMFNPLTNKNEAYEEVWRRLRFAPSDYVIMERVDRAYNAERKREAGATAEEEAHTLPRAFIARLGPWAIGMGRDSKGAFSAYREELEAGRGWVRKYTVGSMLPTLRVLPRLIVGERMRLEVGEWVVRVVGRAGSA